MTGLWAAAAFALCQGLRRRICRKAGAGSAGTLLRNSGAAFSLPIAPEWLAPLRPLALGLAWRQRRRSPLGAGLLLGGGISNLYERRRYGYVLDYLHPAGVPGLGGYVYNAADTLIFAGCALLLAAAPTSDKRRGKGGS